MFGNSFFPFKKASPTATSRGGQRPQGGGASGASDPGAWPRAKELCPLPPSSPTLLSVSASQVCAKAFSLAGNVAREHGLLGSRPAGAIMGTGRAAHAQA